jgi:peptidyl-dipeptidase Dcp
MTPTLDAQTPPPVRGDDNPLLKEWRTPFAVPPFPEIKAEHFLPAFKEAIAQQRKEVDAIADSPQPPSFENTLDAMERAGSLLEKVAPVFSNLSSAETSPHLQAINREVTPMLAALRDDIRLNPRLFARVKAVWERRGTLGLTPVQRRLVEEIYKGFVRGGANLDAVAQQRLREINKELATLGVRFGDNLLHDTNAFRLVIDDPRDLAGLPPPVVAAAAEAAKAAGLPGKWVFTLQAPSIWPFMDYADNRELRRQIFTAYTTRGDHGDEYDNKAVAARIAALRAERAALLGYRTHADFALEENMAKTPDGVYGLLRQLWEPSLAVARQEAADLQKVIDAQGGGFALEPWDWRYYAKKLEQSRFDLDEQALRPYFALDKVRDGAFLVAHRLYGISVAPRPDLPVYHPEVKAFEVKDADGSHLGVFYTDYHPRPGKRVGAWSSRYRGQYVRDGRNVRPVVVNVCNFSRPTGDRPALLSLEEVRTLFHEFGHALHSLLSQVPYQSMPGVPRDFVELPSQIMENWALEPEVLASYAMHYQTGEVIPPALVEKIGKAGQINQGFATVEYLAAALLDMDWHTVTPATPLDTGAFERASLDRMRLIPQIVVRYRSPYFNHVFGPGGGYAAGYYSYVWSEVLDADAFQAFKEKGLFDQATATSFRKNVLERGGTADAAELFRAFRGRDPSVEPLLVKRGLKP